MSGPNIYFVASYGGVELLIAELDTQGGRDIAIQSPSRGDQHTLQDRGRKLLHVSATILFVDQPGQDPYLDRFDSFRSMADGDGAQIFSHPILGSYRARISDFSFRASGEESAVDVNCTILAEDEPQLVFPIAAGVSSGAGVEAVSVAAGTAITALGPVGAAIPTTSVPQVKAYGSALATIQNCINTATSWDIAGDVLDSQAAFSALATLTGQLSTAIDALDLLTDLSRWQAYQAIIGLSFQLRRAAEAATSDASNVISVYVPAPVAMLALCARIYGPALASDRAASVTALNRVRRPGRIEAGTTLKMPADGASP